MATVEVDWLLDIPKFNIILLMCNVICQLYLCICMYVYMYVCMYVYVLGVNVIVRMESLLVPEPVEE